MAKLERRPSRRRQNLEQFKRGEDGKFAYAGVFLAYREGRLPRRRLLKYLGLLAAFSAACVLGGGFLPAAGMRRGFLIVLPYILSLALTAVVLFKTCRLCLAGDPLREYVYEATALMLPALSAAAAILCGVTVLAEICHVLFRGFEGHTAATVCFAALELAAGIALVPFGKLLKTAKWEEVRQDASGN